MSNNYIQQNPQKDVLQNVAQKNNLLPNQQITDDLNEKAHQLPQQRMPQQIAQQMPQQMHQQMQQQMPQQQMPQQQMPQQASQQQIDPKIIQQMRMQQQQVQQLQQQLQQQQQQQQTQPNVQQTNDNGRQVSSSTSGEDNHEMICPIEKKNEGFDYFTPILLLVIYMALTHPYTSKFFDKWLGSLYGKDCPSFFAVTGRGLIFVVIYIAYRVGQSYLS